MQPHPAVGRIKEVMPKVRELRAKVETDALPYVHHQIFNENTDPISISIVMTTNERQEQTLFTLDSISKTSIKNIQVIIVDDSSSGYLPNDKLLTYPFQIDYITIEYDKKEWGNPCVNYNLGFKKIKGSKVIIQNGEVCHIGDVVNHVDKNLKVGDYLNFNVKALHGFDRNKELYNIGTEHSAVAKFLTERNSIWYQHHHHRNAWYHFLTAISYSDFEKLGLGFDFDFAFGSGWDDNDLVDRILKLRLRMITIDDGVHGVMGIHQHHNRSPTNKAYLDMHNINKYMISFKRNYIRNHKVWLTLNELPQEQLESLLDSIPIIP